MDKEITDIILRAFEKRAQTDPVLEWKELALVYEDALIDIQKLLNPKDCL